MKLIQIIELSSSLAKIISQEMPFSLSYKINKLVKIIESNEQFYNSKLHELVSEYAARDNNGNIITEEEGIRLIAGLEDEFHKKHAELRDVEISDELLTFTVSELESLSISPQDLLPLMSLIKE